MYQWVATVPIRFEWTPGTHHARIADARVSVALFSVGRMADKKQRKRLERTIRVPIKSAQLEKSAAGRAFGGRRSPRT